MGPIVKFRTKAMICSFPARSTDIGYFVAMLCSPLTIGGHGEAVGIDGGTRADMHY